MVTTNADQKCCPQVFVTAGLGGMSGAQAKAAVICGCVGVIAEVVLLFIVVVVVDVVIIDNCGLSMVNLC